MYDVQYDATADRPKINQIFIFQTYVKCILFDGVRLRKMFGFINLLLKT